ncbi:hypothetical protein UPYG_G00151780 [Umbra pygmaea]|uniref:G-protein coupled receptors family 1 profile domain-containing protein n=1 Tax=Umbra pygmaea TaxID=75934 RepID=A0ABD0WXC6_UMBPY
MVLDNSTVSNNQTSENSDLDYARKISLVIYCVAFVLGPIGNGLVIYVTGCRIKKTVNSVWFLNLALADFLFTSLLLLYIINISRNYEWPFGDFLCKLNTMVTVVNMFASIFLLVAISLDRFLSTWVVVWAQNQRTTLKAEVICVVIWLTSFVCSLPYTLVRKTEIFEKKEYCNYSSLMDNITYKKILVIFRFLVGFLVPFLIITGSYVAIALRASRLQRGKKRRSLRIIISIVLAFFICWMPFHVFMLLEMSESYKQGNSWLGQGITLAASFAFLNSCLNPILYVFMCDEFQVKLRQSVLLVFESAFAEDHGMSLGSSRSLSSHLSRISRRSESAPAEQKDETGTSLITCQIVK